MPITMKLLMLLPNFILIAISGFNISNEVSSEGANNLAVIVLHTSVLLMCTVFVTLIIKSMFQVVEIEENILEAQ
jgi:hypothetical protein